MAITPVSVRITGFRTSGVTAAGHGLPDDRMNLH
jgi:hypothetical protein